MASSENAGDVMLSKVCTPVMRATVFPSLVVERRANVGVAVGAGIDLDLRRLRR
jgi:hypothetical protein